MSEAKDTGGGKGVSALETGREQQGELNVGGLRSRTVRLRKTGQLPEGGAVSVHWESAFPLEDSQDV